jgi:hypothetical protein
MRWCVAMNGVRWTIVSTLCWCCMLGASALDAHPGGLDAQGCQESQDGRVPLSSRACATPKPAANDGTYYRNCSEVRAAGKAPLRRGDPGYAPHLDRDGDGIACE